MCSHFCNRPVSQVIMFPLQSLTAINTLTGSLRNVASHFTTCFSSVYTRRLTLLPACGLSNKSSEFVTDSWVLVSSVFSHHLFRIPFPKLNLQRPRSSHGVLVIHQLTKNIIPAAYFQCEWHYDRHSKRCCWPFHNLLLICLHEKLRTSTCVWPLEQVHRVRHCFSGSSLVCVFTSSVQNVISKIISPEAPGPDPIAPSFKTIR